MCVITPIFGIFETLMNSVLLIMLNKKTFHATLCRGSFIDLLGYYLYSMWYITVCKDRQNPNPNTLIFPENLPDTERIEYKVTE